MPSDETAASIDADRRRRKTANPCPRCRAHRDRCFCADIPRLDLATRLVLVVHHRELDRTTNTGTLATAALTNSRTFVRGEGRERLDLSEILSPEYASVLLHPSDDALAIEDLRVDKPIQLIVPDGNWRQAAKVHTRHPELAHLPRVKLTRPNDGAVHLRKEHFATGYSTLEAIAWAVHRLEGPEVGARLLALYRRKVESTLAGRGVNVGSTLATTL